MITTSPISLAKARERAANGPWLWIGLILVCGAWGISWFGTEPARSYTFFPLWLGYILTVDGLTARRRGTSLLARSPRDFGLLFLFSAPLWWLFEGANHFLGNWRYVLPHPWDTLNYILVATLSFSTVMPAIFVSAELLRTVATFSRPRRWVRIDPGRGLLVALPVAGAAMFVLSLLFPRYLFPLVWIGLFLALDPVNARLGNPSLASQVRYGRWENVLVLGAAGLVCGFFWELWNVNAMPKWVYEVPLVGHMPKLFEMPILGYGGYVPFALEGFAAWSFMSAFTGRRPEKWPSFASLDEQPSNDGNGGGRPC